jgi:CDP-6-deoxy-D-xylo-4-hexulose-3-dehydrase
MNWKLQGRVFNKLEIELDQFTMGEKVREFEKAWASHEGKKYGVMTNSGSSANLLMMKAVKEVRGLPDGCEVIVPAVTWGSTVASVIHAGMTPVFVDVNLNDFGFEYEKVDEAVTRKTKVLFPTHVLGFTPDRRELEDIAEHFHLVLVEDCCETGGAVLTGKTATYSFYWGHHMTTIEGGMVVTDDELIWKSCMVARDHGLDRSIGGKDFNFIGLGYKRGDGIIGCLRIL